jgi:hypothetical protein
MLILVEQEHLALAIYVAMAMKHGELSTIGMSTGKLILLLLGLKTVVAKVHPVNSQTKYM